jgi:hypothetical protein
LFDISILATLGGRPDVLLKPPLTGGVGGGKDIEDGEARGFGCEEFRMLTGLLLGGGGGFALFDRCLPISAAAILGLPSSSAFGDRRPVSRVILESDTSWLCRRVRGGAGAVFRRIEADGDGGSGVFPAASLSNIDSRSDSWEVRFGAGGSGLLRSVFDRFWGLEVKNC